MRGDWTQEGCFRDAEGSTVAAYDDVRLLVEAEVTGKGTAKVDKLPAGSSGTVLLFTEDLPARLSLEVQADPGFAFAEVTSDKVVLLRTAKQKWPDKDDHRRHFTPEQIAAIESGLAAIERGDTIPHDQVVAEIKAKFGW